MFFFHNRTNDMAYSCYLVNPEQIKSITQPVHKIHYMHHITVDFGIPNDSPLPPKPKDVRVIGLASDDKAQALVVSVDGKKLRSDGRPFHITVSTADNVKPYYSNRLLESGYTPINPINIDLEPSIVNW